MGEPLEIAGVVTGVAAVYLTVRQIVWCWPLGMINVALFAIVFARAGLYANAGLQVVYFALCAYGWWAWRRGGEGAQPLPVARLPRRFVLPLAAAAGTAALALGTLLARQTDASVPYLDSALAAASLAAQWLQARKWIENWPLWIAVNGIYVGLYLSQDLLWTAALYLGFLALAVAGWREWGRSLPRRSGEAV